MSLFHPSLFPSYLSSLPILFYFFSPFTLATVVTAADLAAAIADDVDVDATANDDDNATLVTAMVARGIIVGGEGCKRW